MSRDTAPATYRRRGPVFLQCTDRLWLDPLALLGGTLTPQRLPLLRAYAPPATEPVELEPLGAACLAALSSGVARALPEALRSCVGVDAALRHLLDAGLIEVCAEHSADSASALTDPPLDDWFGPAAAYHFASRWRGVVARDEVPVEAQQAARAFENSRKAFEQQTLARGTPPTHRPLRGDSARAVDLPQPEATPFDRLLKQRETHRLFDTDASLTLVQVAQLLLRSFGVLGEAPLGGGLTALRKSSPSGGGMHPIEAYLLAVRVQGLESGWYHYRAADHQLAPIRALAAHAARDCIVRATAGQAYFSTAPMIVALTLRFPRHHWKYPQHARAYRVMQLEAGHVGQTFYLSATEAGLGAFITAAINDADVDAELGLDGTDEGCIAIVGCGTPAIDGSALRLSSYLAD